VRALAVCKPPPPKNNLLFFKFRASSSNYQGTLVEPHDWRVAVGARPPRSPPESASGSKGTSTLGLQPRKRGRKPPPHVSTCVPADLENGSDDVDSRAARSTGDSNAVSSHVDGILEHDLNYPHDLGQVLASDLSSIAGVPSSEVVCPIAVVAAFDGGRGVCKNYSERLNSDVYGDEASNREPFDEQEQGASNGEPFVGPAQRKEVPEVRAKRVPIVVLCVLPLNTCLPLGCPYPLGGLA
jgi:hypothetical protein